MDDQENMIGTVPKSASTNPLTPAQDLFARVLGDLLAEKCLAEHANRDCTLSPSQPQLPPDPE
jgi:hypothetical protein